MADAEGVIFIPTAAGRDVLSSHTSEHGRPDEIAYFTVPTYRMSESNNRLPYAMIYSTV